MTAVSDDVGTGSDSGPSDLLGRLHRLLEPSLARLSGRERLTELLSRVRDVCDADVASVVGVDRSQGDLVVWSSVGLDVDAVVGLRMPTEESLAGSAATLGATVAAHGSDLERRSPVLTARGIVAAAAAPIVVDEVVVAVVVVGRRALRPLGEIELAGLDLSAKRLALALEHERVSEVERERHLQAERSVERFQALHDLSAALTAAVTPPDVISVTLEHGLSSIGALGGTLAVLEGDELVICGSVGLDPQVAAQWQRFPLAADVPLAEAVRRQETVYVRTMAEFAGRFPDVSHQVPDETHSVLAVPLAAAGEVLGGIVLRFGVEEAFTDQDLRQVEAVVRQCAQALSRARLYVEEQQASARLRFLARASELLLSSLDYETTLRSLAEAVVPEIADWCAVDMVTDRGVERLAVAHTDPAKVALAHELQVGYPFDPDAATGLAQVLRSGATEFIEVITDDFLSASAPDARWLEIVRSLGLRSAVTVPLSARGAILGALTLVASESGRSFSPDDLALIEDLARIAAVAVDNSRLFNDRSEVARALQSSLLPPVLPRIPRLDVAARYLPSGLQAEVGGDFYDVFRDVGGQWALVIGDVCGKGPEAAAVTGLARHTVRAVAQHDPAPGVILDAVNSALLDQVPLGRFCTIGYARFDVESPEIVVTVASGGHPLALVRRPSGLVEAIGRPGMLVGVSPIASCPEDVATLGPGDALLLYTDGLVERHKEAGGVEDGEPALRAVLARCDDLTADEIADLVLSVAFDQPHGARDDVALLVVRVTE